MRAENHVLVFRLMLLGVFAFSALNCSDGDGPEGCNCDCLDSPGEPPDDDDDSGGVIGDDDDTSPTDDDDDDTSPGDDDDDDEDVTLGLPPCEGGIAPAFSVLEFEPPDANSDGYFAPSSDTLEAILSSVQALMAGNLSLSVAEVAVVGYEVCRGEGPEAGVALWRSVDPGTGRALFAWRAVGARPLILGVPYPVTESPTMTEGVLAFTDLSARALIVGGTNRCASTVSSDCDGTTAACGGGQQPYRDSDIGHVMDSVYQIAHEFLSEVHEDDLVVTLRGLSAFGVSISDGTTDPSSAETPARAMKPTATATERL